MAGKTIKCHFCQGERELMSDGKTCSGCGSPAANAVRKKRIRIDAPHCPRCGSTKNIVVENNERWCRNCRTQYGGEDFSFVDDRPVENAMKRGL